MAALVSLSYFLGKLVHIAFLVIVVTQLKHQLLYKDSNHLLSKAVNLQVAMEISNPMVVFENTRYDARKSTRIAALEPATPEQILL